MEMIKCEDLVLAVTTHITQGRNTTVDGFSYSYKNFPILQCIKGSDQYDCMKKIFNGDADIMQLETGLSYTAGQYYNMMPLVAEKYQPGCEFYFTAM
jgi:melanoma-associated antigen p97